MAWSADERSLDQLEHQLARRYVDLAVRLRVMREDGRPGALLPKVIGGRWDTLAFDWVRPQPPDLDVVEWSIQEQQRQIIDLPSDVIFAAIFAGRQAGKTHAAVMQVVIDALRWPGRQSAIVSLEFKASRDPQRAFASFLRPEWRVSYKETDRTYTFPNGHAVVFRTAEAIDSIRGPSLKTVLLDEAARMSHDHFLTAVGCGMASKNFRIYLATTPKREQAWLRDVDEKWDQIKVADRPHHRVLRLRTADNPRRNQELLDEIARDTPADIYEQEFEGKLVAPADAVYGRLFSRTLHVRRPGSLPEPACFSVDREDGRPKIVDVTREFTLREFGVAAEYLAGWDFGSEAVVIAKVFRDFRQVPGERKGLATERVWIVGEEVDENATTDHHARHVAERWGTSMVIVTDAMGARDRSEGRGQDSAAIELLNEHGFLEVRPVAARNPAVDERVRTVNRALRSARRSADWPTGETKLFIAPGVAPRLIDALENQRMIHGQPEKDDKHEHVADALGYLLYAIMPVRAELPSTFERAGRAKGP